MHMGDFSKVEIPRPIPMRPENSYFGDSFGRHCWSTSFGSCISGLTFSFLRGGTALEIVASPGGTYSSQQTHGLKHVSNDLDASVSKSQSFLAIDAQSKADSVVREAVLSESQRNQGPVEDKGSVAKGDFAKVTMAAEQ